ncbi:SDR family NAD(P)-dependent oxidoreductase [Spirosoma sp. SC4-14]|uniref:SDR family NAD(P)-dependent oxidoreductase n=1 Tax=Spirosoma sp. SC4-14 TaxID=3128900 RepID=UPI0030CBAA3C
MSLDYQRIVLITGTGQQKGIGFGLAKALLAQEHTVILTARNESIAHKLASQLAPDKNPIFGKSVDTTNQTSVDRLADWVREHFGRLDILINAVGSGFDYGISPLHTDFALTQIALETNLFGTWRMIKAFYPLLRQSPSARIVNVSSGAGSFSDARFGLSANPVLMTSYGLSKLALNGLTVQLARELKPDGILVNAVNPGFMTTISGAEAAGTHTVSASIEGVMWAATLPDDGPTGGFFEDCQLINW